MAPQTTAEQAAYNAANQRAKKQAARDRGAADAIAEAPASVVEAARQRALGGGAPATPAVASQPAPTSGLQQFVQVTARGKQYRVPDPQWYSLSQEQQARYLDAVDGDGQSKRDESVALQSVNQLLDLRDRDTAKAAKREAALLDVIAGLTARVDALEQADRTHEIKASRELAEQQARLSEAVIAASGVEASLRNQTAASQVEHDRQGVESRAALEAQATAIDALKGSVKSTTQLMAERSNAIQDQLAQVAPQVQKLAGQQVGQALRKGGKR